MRDNVFDDYIDKNGDGQLSASKDECSRDPGTKGRLRTCWARDRSWLISLIGECLYVEAILHFGEENAKMRRVEEGRNKKTKVTFS